MTARDPPRDSSTTSAPSSATSRATARRRFRGATTRRRFLGAVGAGGALLTGGAVPTGATTASRSDLPEEVGVERVAGGFAAPVAVEFPPGGDRGYVVDQSGQVYAVGPDGRPDDPFLDVTDRMVSLGGGYDERGLLGLAFHPEFASNGRLFVRYSAPPRDGTPSGYDHTFVLAEFAATGDPPTVEDGSERAILEIPQPQSNHNAGAVAFGPDGYLYVGVGDGGAGGDRGRGHVRDWYDAVDGGNGQDVTGNLLGSVLRIDVDGRDGDRPYAVPADNPLVGREGLDEQYAWGFRNPWRFSFDGDRLFVADVGQNQYEEVSLVERGGNYGWNVREGAHCYAAADCPTAAPDRPPYDGQPLVDPVIEYPHSGDGPTGIAVIGGFVYRGEAVPALRDRYVFADWRAGGTLFVATEPEGGGRWPVESVPMTAVGGPGPGSRVLGFGRDADGELYVCSTNRGGVGGESGAVHRLVPADGSGSGTGDDGTTDGGDGTTDGGTADDGTARTASPGQPGFGALAGLLGLGGAAGYLLAGRDD